MLFISFSQSVLIRWRFDISYFFLLIETTSEWILDSLTEEEREELFDSIGYGGSSASPQTNPEVSMPSRYLKNRLCMHPDVFVCACDIFFL